MTAMCLASVLSCGGRVEVVLGQWVLSPPDACTSQSVDDALAA